MNLLRAIVLLSLLLTGGCIAPVRTNIFPLQEKTEEEESPAIRPPQLQGVAMAKAGRDTLVIDQTVPLRKQTAVSAPVQAITGGAGGGLPLEFEQALELFDREQFTEACDRFSVISETLPVGDSLRYESRFMEAECAILRTRLPDAISILQEMSMDEGTPPTVLERTLIRLGQTYCLAQDYEKAALIFRQFSTRFPSSLYAALANCAAAGSQ